MMKVQQLIVLLLMLSSFGFSAIKGALPEVLKPDNIAVYENDLYVIEGAEISTYSLEDLKFLRKFGKKGEGPGELIAIPNFYNKVNVFPDYILVGGFNKIIYFSREGKLLKEKKKSFVIFQVTPMGNNFAVNRIKQGDDKKIYSTIAICNPEFEDIKELYRQEHVQQGAPPNAKLDMVMDFVYYKVHDGKIFIDRSPDGFIIDVFDSQGNKLYQIEKEYEKLPVTDRQKEEITERFKEDPSIKSARQAVGGWEALKKIFTMNFPKLYPAIQELEITGGKIYVQTFKVKENKSEYVIMDLKGKVIKTVYLPRFENTPMMSKILGAKLHTIYNDKLYYLMENEDEEVWELNVEEIK